MDPREFVELVAQMRAAQRAFFEARRLGDESIRSHLAESKRLEKRVDEALKEALSGQRSLFETAS